MSYNSKNKVLISQNILSLKSFIFITFTSYLLTKCLVYIIKQLLLSTTMIWKHKISLFLTSMDMTMPSNVIVILSTS